MTLIHSSEEVCSARQWPAVLLSVHFDGDEWNINNVEHVEI